MLRWIAIFALVVVATAATYLAAAGPWWWLLAGPLLALAALGVYDLVQRRHSILRNYPVLGHLRYVLESIRPELQQYFVERNFDGRPYDRDTRTVIYERAKGIHGEQAFGTERDVYEVGYEYLLHSPIRRRKPRRRRGFASEDRTAPSPTTWRCSTSPP